MDDPELTKYLVLRLGNTASKNDLIMELCERHGFSWSEAEALLQRVEAEHEGRIAGRRFPLLFVIALGIFLGGLALVIYDAYVFISLLETDLTSVFTSLDAATHMRLIFDIGIAPITGMIIGAAMMLGSLVGMRRAWTPLLDHWLETKHG
ncbi:MAG: hypothetical protein AB1531_12165 [Chloroflexota bacterium]